MAMQLPPDADLSTIPLLPNPDGSPPNFEDPPSLHDTTYAVCILMMIMMTLIFALRIRTNLKVYSKLAIDDYCCIVAWVLSMAYSVLVMTSTSTARHIWDVPISAINASWIKRSAVLGTIYGPAMWFAKTAILTMYLRLFSVKTWMQWCCHGAIWFLFIAYWSLFPVSIVYNFPHGDEKWDLEMSMGAAKAQIAFVVMGMVSVVADLYILILPIPILFGLQVSWKRKLGLCVVFLTAIVGIVSSVVVFYLRLVLYRNQTQDMTWNVAASYLTVAVELCVAVMVSCTPATAASWRVVLQDSKLVSTLRSAFGSTRSLVRVGSTERSKGGAQISSRNASARDTEAQKGSATSLVPLGSIHSRG